MEGINLCKKFEGEFPKRYAQDCFDFMRYSYKEAIEIIDKFRPSHLWEKKIVNGKGNKIFRKSFFEEGNIKLKSFKK